MTGGLRQASKDGTKVESSVEQILDLPEIAMPVLVEAERVIRPGQGRLEVAQGRVDGLERRMLGAGGTAAGDVLLVQDAHAAHGGEAAQAIGDQGRWSGQGLLSEDLDGILGEGPLRQTHQDGLPGFGGLNRHHEGDLVLRAPAGLAAGALATEVGVVGLDAAGQLPVPLAQEHHLHELVLDQPGGGVGHIEVALEFQRRDVVLGLRHQVHGQEPLGQCQLAGLEDRAAEHAALVATGAALEVQAILPTELAVPAALAAWADEALGPAPALDRFLATLMRAIEIEELQHRQTPLILHLVLRHGQPPVQVGTSSQPGGSQREPLPGMAELHC